MASSSTTTNPNITQQAAEKLADVWETRIRRLIANDNAATFLKSQKELYTDLHMANLAVTKFPLPEKVFRLMDFLVPVFIHGQTLGPNGDVLKREASWGRVKRNAEKFDVWKAGHDAKNGGRAKGHANGGEARGPRNEGKKGSVEVGSGPSRHPKDEVGAKTKGKAKEVAGKGQVKDVERVGEKGEREKAKEGLPRNGGTKGSADAEGSGQSNREPTGEGGGKAKGKAKAVAGAARTRAKGEKDGPKEVLPERDNEGSKESKAKGKVAKAGAGASRVRGNGEKETQKEGLPAREDEAGKEVTQNKGKVGVKAKAATHKKATAASVAEDPKGKNRLPEGEPPEPLVHRYGSSMTVSKPTKGNQKGRKTRVKSDSVIGDTDDEVLPVKGKRKAASVEDEQEDEDKEGEEDDDEDQEEEDEKVAPLDRARALHPLKRAPADYIEVEDKCATCNRLGQRCQWKPEAIKKAGPKACWRCHVRKVACHSSFRTSGAAGCVLIDLGTPLGDLADRLIPPPPPAKGVPRAGILGEDIAVPETVGELLVELLATVRATREENRELKREMKIIHDTLGTMNTYDTKHQHDVMEALEALPAVLRPRLPPSPSPVPQHTAPTPQPPSPLPPSTPPMQRLVASSPPPFRTPVLRMLPRIAIPIVNSDRDEPSITPRPGGSRAGSSASLPGEEVPDGDEPLIPSVVADRTRHKTKAAAVPAEPDGDEASSALTSESEEEPLAKGGEKRKVAPEHVEPAGPNKKSKVATAKGKAPARKAKAPPKKG